MPPILEIRYQAVPLDEPPQVADHATLVSFPAETTTVPCGRRALIVAVVEAEVRTAAPSHRGYIVVAVATTRNRPVGASSAATPYSERTVRPLIEVMCHQVDPLADSPAHRMCQRPFVIVRSATTRAFFARVRRTGADVHPLALRGTPEHRAARV